MDTKDGQPSEPAAYMILFLFAIVRCRVQNKDRSLKYYYVCTINHLKS